MLKYTYAAYMHLPAEERYGADRVTAHSGTSRASIKSRKVNDLFLRPVFFYFLVLPSSLGIKADSTALYVAEQG